MDKDGPSEKQPEEAPGGFPVAFGVFFFAAGIAAGFLLAFTGVAFVEESAGIIAGVFLATILVVAVAGLALLLLRKRILRALFGMAETQVEHLSVPMAEVARGVALRDPEAAVGSTSRLIRAVMARYAWLSTRRWIMTSLTALIAAMAALAGTALLFRQNALLGEQIDLMAVQNARIERQNTLLEQQTELAEAARNAALTVEVTAVAEQLGALADGGGIEPRLDATTLGRGLIFRIVALSQVLRPYRFLDLGLDASDEEQGRLAMDARRAVLPGVWARMAVANGWQDGVPRTTLIDRPASPERGQLLRVMLVNGIRDFGPFVDGGLTLSYAYAPGLRGEGIDLAGGDLTLADLSRGAFSASRFDGARMGNARFVATELTSVQIGGGGGPTAPNARRTDLTGADFSQAALIDCDLSGVFAMGAVFDDALLMGVDFIGATLPATSFRGAVLIAPEWRGAMLAYADFDGAFVFGADPLAEIAATSEGFPADHYRAEPATVEAVVAATRWGHHDAETIAAHTGGAPAWRLVRIRDFE
ncbi:MAG: hypothetical protein Kow0013_24280 [Pararhodobacter sp.]